MNLTPCTRVALAGALLLCSTLAHAGIQLGATRAILAAPAKETSIAVNNRVDQDIMIQSWVEADGAVDAADEGPDVPFAITPALSRLGGLQQQTLRIFYQGQGLPTDRESVFWLSVQEIPQKSRQENVLQIAVRQRIKLFYRPAGLPGKPEEAANGLRWQLGQQNGRSVLRVTNPSAYHVSLSSARLRDGARSHVAETTMVAPGATASFPFKTDAGRPSGNASVSFEYVNDYGGVDTLDSALSP